MDGAAGTGAGRRRTSGWRRAVGAALALMVLATAAGCSGGSDEPESRDEPTGRTEQEPSGVTLEQLTDEPSRKIKYPTISMPEGASYAQVDWMVKQLIEVGRRSLEVEKLSRRSDAKAARWALTPVVGSDYYDHAGRLRKAFGKGHSFLVGNRFAPDALPTGPAHLLGQRWEATVEKSDGRQVLQVEATLEVALPFDDGVAVVSRSLVLRAPTEAATDGTYAAGFTYRLRETGIDRCAVLREGAARPGDLADVADDLDDLTDREEPGGLSRWASAGSDSTSDPKEERAECAEPSDEDQDQDEETT